MLTIIIPAYNEQAVIADCLRNVLAQSDVQDIEVIVSANGCTDNTVAICESFRPAFTSRGFSFQVLQTEQGSKIHALNLADTKAQYSSRLYLDADVTCCSRLLQQTSNLLNRDDPVYFSGTLSIPYGKSFFSNAYGKIWTALPYIRNASVGIGCYGVNAAGRALWDKFPSIHSDDKFVRMQFPEHQRVKLDANYQWPVPQGLLTLVKVRTRWIKGNKELQSKFPHLPDKKSERNRLKMDKKSLTTMLCNPLHTFVFVVIYAISALLAEVSRDHTKIKWSRAR